MKKLIPSEYQEQCAVIDWWNSYAPTRGFDPILLVCSANGAMLAGDARLRAIQMYRLKKSGLRDGDPDLSLRVPVDNYHGAFIEMKKVDWKEPKSGKALEHFEKQRKMHRILRARGYAVWLCLGAEEAISAIKRYLI